MERNQISKLLQKYYDGMSSAEEEKSLMELFRGEDYPDEFEIDRKHFLALADMQNEEIEVPENLESEILARLAEEQTPVRRINTRFIYTVASIAAGLALIFSTFTFLNNDPDLGTYDDPQLAYAETVEALELVSRVLNQGTEKLSGLEEMDKALKPLVQLDKVNEVSDNLKYLGKLDEGVKKTRDIINK